MKPEIEHKIPRGPVNVVVGAGIAGLTIAQRLASAGLNVVVIERDSEVGGLARSFKYGEYVFDIGPHRFHTSIDEIADFVKSILDNRFLNIGRMSSVHLLDKYHQWPLGFRSVMKLPITVLFSAFLDLFRRPPFDGDRFDSYIISQYGKTLFKLFFQDYTEKFSFLKSDNINYRWATTGIDRALIDKRIRLESLGDALKLVLKPVSVKTVFIYPHHGIQEFSDRLADSIKLNGGMIYTGIENLRLHADKTRITSVSIDSGETFEVDKLIWTGNLNSLMRQLSFEPQDLRYLPIVVYNIEMNKPVPNMNQWIYFQGKEYVFSRVSIPQRFSPLLVPEGCGSLCAEVTAENEHHDYWQSPETLTDNVLKGLEKTGLLKTSQVNDVHIERVRDAYPLYELKFPEKKKRVFDKLDIFENLILAGRSGLFWYNNMDHSIENGLEISAKLMNEVTAG